MQNKQKVWSFFSMLLDCGLFFLSYFAAVVIRFRWLGGVVTVSPWSSHFIITAGLYSVVIVLAYGSLHLYNRERRGFLANCLILTAVNGIGVGVLMALLYIFRITDFSRLALLIFWALSSGVIVAKRLAITLVIRRAQRRGRALRHILVVGSGALAARYVRDLENSPNSGCRIEGSIGADACPGCAYLGGYGQIEKVLGDHRFDEVVVALDPEEAPMIRQILETVGNEGIRITLVPIFSEYIPASPTVRTVGSTAVINMRSTRLDHPGWAMVKRGTDILGSAIMLLLLAPVMLLIALGVRLSSPGPVLFRQERVGLDKRPFQMLKFRSMRVNEASDTAWSSAGDPRKTRFGSFLRRYSLDELPQLFNVLKGDMSLVGPRPEIPYHVERFKKNIPLYLVRQQIRPGMTGWAQVNGLRGDTSIERRVEYDIWYIENWSLWLDVKILLKTAFGGMINPAEGKKGAKP